MTVSVHPTALVDPSAELGDGTVVGPFAIVGPHVVTGPGCRLDARVSLERYVRLGAEVRVGVGSVLGGPPQDLKFKGEETWVEIGEGTRIREYTTINRGTSQSFKTTVGKGCFLMSYVHLAHDCHIGDGAAQLVVIASQSSWATVHWLIAFGYVLVIAGMIGVLTQHAPTPGATAARTGVLLQLFGYGINLVGLLFMLGAGTHLAAAYQAAQPGLTATHAAFLFDMMHPSARAALRVAPMPSR